MCILCIRMKDNLRGDHKAPAKAARPGDCIDVFEDGTDPGGKVVWPDWLLVKIPGVARDKVLPFIEPEYSGETRVRSRIYRVAVGDIPAAILDIAAATGEIVVGSGGDVTKQQLLGFVKRLSSGQSADEEGITL